MSHCVPPALGLTFRILALTATLGLTAGRLPAQVISWTGADATNSVSTNWSDAANWSGGTPGPVTNVFFFNPGATATKGVVNNIVGSNTAILTLNYANTNGYHTTQIPAGFTLTITNKTGADLIVAGTGTDNGASQSLYATITGAGTLNVFSTNTGSDIIVQQGSGTAGSHLATLDLSGLATLNLAVGQMLIGSANLGAGASNWLQGTLYLAATNLIRLNSSNTPALDIGDAYNNGATNCLYLGQTNAIYADTVTVAHSKAVGTIAFNPALVGSNPVLILNGNTNARVSYLSVGDFTAQQTSGATVIGTLNLNAGRSSVMADACYVGLGQSGNGTGTATGTLSLGAGTFNVNDLTVGCLGSVSAAANVTGTVNVTNGTLTVNDNLLLASDPGAPATAYGTLNITNGTVLANTITSGDTAKITLHGGLLVVSNTLCSPAVPLTSLTLAGGATLQFSVTNRLTNAAITTLTGDNSGVINIAALPVYLNYPTWFPLIVSPHGGATNVTFAIGTLPATCQGYIFNDNSNLISLVITNGPTLPKTNLWTGNVNGNWDTNTLNWTNNNTAVTYAENDLVIFNDSARTGTVTLTGSAPHTPYALTVTNNLLPYTFTGTNSLAGPVTLAKSGTNSLTLAENNDTFTGGLAVNGGTVILDGTNNNASGGILIAGGATLQVGNSDAKGDLPDGGITNNGSFVFSQTITNLVTAPIGGTGSLTQNGPGTLQLGGTNTYTGSTFVFSGRLALTGSIAASTNVAVSGAKLDLSALAGTNILGNLNMTNGTLILGQTVANVAGLSQGGASNVISLTSLASIPFYPTNFTLLQSATAISGYNFVLGTLPAGTPAYAGTLTHTATNIVLNLTAGPSITVTSTVTYTTNAGFPLNHAFVGLSYEKSELTSSLFTSNNTSLINTFAQIAPAVLRVGGNSVDTTCWGGVSNLPAITTTQLDAFAGFVHALPTNWHVMYGINLSVNSPTNAAAEAAYAANALGSSLLGFEIGNECDLYYNNGLRPSNYTYTDFLAEWRAMAAAIVAAVPGWAGTNGGVGWTFTGPVSADNTAGYTVPFAAAEKGTNALLTQHYYRANGQSTNSTLALLLAGDSSLPGIVSNLVTAATTNNLPLGFRMAECGSFYNGGAPNVSDAYGTALWALDYMFVLALNGAQGLNFHGGGSGTGYTPIADNGTAVIQVRPEYYALKMFSLLSQGNAIPATVTLSSNVNFSAYGVRRPAGGITALLNNKETNHYAQVTVSLGTNVTAAQAIWLAGPYLSATNGYTLGGAVMNANGSWTGGVQATLPAVNGQLTVVLPPITALLLNPVAPPLLAFSSPTNSQHVTNAFVTVTGTAADNQGVANVWYQLNNGAWNAAATANGWTNWNTTLGLAAGTNTLKAYAVNLASLTSLTNSLTLVASNAFQLQLTFTAANPLATNGLNFSLALSPGVNGHLQVTTNLTSGWTTFTNFTGTNSLLNFRDPAATNSSPRFYRAVIP